MLEKFLSPSIAELFRTEYFGNSFFDYSDAIFIFIISLGVLYIFQRILLGKIRGFVEKTETDLDDALLKIIETLRPPFYSFLAFYVAIQSLSLAPLFGKIITTILIIWVVYQIVVALQVFIDYMVHKVILKESPDKMTESAIDMIKFVAKIVIWSMGILMVLGNIGVNITSLVAGLGIGGIAVALALQNILGDLFSSFAIYFDKPFAVGDFIVIGEHMGTVEKIGIKTTRIRALQGEEIVISNKELTGSRVQNFKKLTERRAVFGFGVLYETHDDTLEQIPHWIKEIIEHQKKSRFDRAHFKSFGDSSLDFEAVYYVTSGNFAEYMDAQQEINMAIRRKFAKEGVEMAYPTRTVYLKKE